MGVTYPPTPLRLYLITIKDTPAPLSTYPCIYIFKGYELFIMRHTLKVVTLSPEIVRKIVEEGGVTVIVKNELRSGGSFIFGDT